MNKDFCQMVLEVIELTNEDFGKLINSELERLKEAVVLDCIHYIENDLLHILIVTMSNTTEIIYDLKSQSISNNSLSRKGVDSAVDIYSEDESDTLPFPRLEEKFTASMDVSYRKPTPRLVHKLMYAIEMLQEKDYGCSAFSFTEDIENGLLTLLFEAEGDMYECFYSGKERSLTITGLAV